MNEKKYAIGIDFGTLSGRAVLVDVGDGSEVATAVFDYSNGVIDHIMPGALLESVNALNSSQNHP